MIWFYLITLIFIVLLILPFVISLMYAKNRNEPTLNIKNDNIRDPRYFAKSFSELVAKGLSEEKGMIFLSREEPFVTPEQLLSVKCKNIVYSKDNFTPKNAHIFLKEIFVKKEAKVAAKTKLRAVMCQDKLTLGEGCEVLRWADGENLIKIGKNCSLGISSTSEKVMVIDTGCQFRRLYAPEIYVGSQMPKQPSLFTESNINNEIIQDTKHVKEGEFVKNTIVTNYDLVIGKNAIIFGNVKTSKRLTIHKNAKISGNVVSDGMLLIEEGVKIAGNVFSQATIIVGPNAQIGMKPKIKSLVAKNDIILCDTSTIYGYIGCENIGKTITNDEFSSKFSNSLKRRRGFAKKRARK